MSDLAIHIRHVRKSFGGVHALKNVNLSVRHGTIHALVGENGAGKSTLMKILSGIHARDHGSIEIDGEEVAFHSPRDSRRKGIAIVHQELELATDLSVAENIFLDNLGGGSPYVSWEKVNRRAEAVLRAFGFEIAPTTLVADLGIAHRQIIEIVKALTQSVRILILDEPTAVLATSEIKVLFANLKRLRSEGVAIIYISHRLQEVFQIADDITVLKDGETVATLDPAACTENDIITRMVGRPLSSLFPPKPDLDPEAKILLEVNGLCRHRVLRNVTLRVRAGEIVGLAGLVGSGRTEVARCLFGLDRMDAGTVRRAGVPCPIRSPHAAMRLGIGLVPEDRQAQGGLLELPIATNVTFADLGSVSRFGIINHASENQRAETARAQLQIKLGSIANPLSSLSGGNQQKVILSKWLSAGSDVLILDEPTRGIDVGTKAEIFSAIHAMAARGLAVLLISSELMEIVGLCHHVYVMCEGTVAGELAADEITEEAVMRLAIPRRPLAAV
jgi:ribose transport system ATP-binding protein